MEHISDQRQEIARLVGGLEALVHDLEGSVEAMREGDGKGVDGLRTEMWEIEKEAKTMS